MRGEGTIASLSRIWEDVAIVFPGIENSKTKGRHNSCCIQSSNSSSENIAWFQMEAEARLVPSDYFSLYHCFSLNACSNDLLKAQALVHCFEVQPVRKALSLPFRRL